MRLPLDRKAQPWRAVGNGTSTPERGARRPRALRRVPAVSAPPRVRRRRHLRSRCASGPPSREGSSPSAPGPSGYVRAGTCGQLLIWRRVLFEQAVGEGIANELGPRPESKLLHDVRPVRFGCAYRDVEQLGDLLVRVAEREQPQHFSLTFGKWVGSLLVTLPRLRLEKPRAEGRVQLLLTARDLPHRLHDLGVRSLLEHVAARALREGLAHVARVVLHREDEHLRVGRLVQNERSAFDSARARHDDVHHDHVGLLCAHLEDGIANVARLADDLDVRSRFEHAPEARPHDGVVVDENDPDRHQVTGTSATTDVPPLDDDSTKSLPSISSIRSRMPIKPSPPSRVSSTSNPCPSSSITAATLSGLRLRSTLTPEARECLITFVSASW